MHGVGVHIVQAGEKRLLIRDSRFPVLKPNFAARSFIFAIDCPGCYGVKLPDELQQRGRFARRSCDEVIVIGKDGPCFEFPAVGCGELQERFAKVSETIGGAKEWLLLIGSRGHDEGARCFQAMRGTVRPVGHGRESISSWEERQSGARS